MPTRTLQRLECTLRFDTPAFLGDAAQAGVWRTPPFKALLRQWWRVRVAGDCAYDVAELRRREHALFGGVFGEGEPQACASQVRLRLGQWRAGTLKSWPAGETRVTHPEVHDPKTGQLRPVGAELYLGYGPLLFRQGATALKSGAALQAGDRNTLTLIAPEQAQLTDLLRLIDAFGTLGGRSRNGWGSLALAVDGQALPAVHRDDALLRRLSRPLADCLRLDWPHAFGTDDQGLLIWQTAPQPDWRKAMVELARIKIAFRTRHRFQHSGRGNPVFEDRHLLAYPVTNHPVRALGNQARLAGQLRFKVVRAAGGFAARIFHLPCAFPEALKQPFRHPLPASLNRQQAIWQDVHAVLDGFAGLQRF